MNDELDPNFLNKKFNINKWARFKECRLDTVRNYIRVRRKLAFSRIIIIALVHYKVIYNSFKAYRELREERRRHFYVRLLSVRMIRRYRKRWNHNFG